jgi:hypothetical protein
MDKPFEKKLIHTVFGQGYILKDESRPWPIPEKRTRYRL